VLSTSFVGYTPVYGGVVPMVEHGYGTFYKIEQDWYGFNNIFSHLNFIAMGIIVCTSAITNSQHNQFVTTCNSKIKTSVKIQDLQ
jgi:hypothetical protein